MIYELSQLSGTIYLFRSIHQFEYFADNIPLYLIIVLTSLLINPVKVVEDVGEYSGGFRLATAQAPADDSSQHEVF